VGDFVAIQNPKEETCHWVEEGMQWERTWGRRVFVEGKQNDAVLWGFFFKKKKKKITFYSNNGILVILHPKTTLFWVFHPFSRFYLMEGFIL
jgi:hypothetical protein